MLSCICTFLSCLHAYASFFHAFMHMHLSFMLSCCLTCFCLVIFQFCFVLFLYKKKVEKSEKYKNSVCFVYIGTCVPWMTIKTKFSKLYIICSLDEHLYTQLSKWVLWLLFVMSKIKLSLVLNTHITLFDGISLLPANHVWNLYASA